MTRIAALTSLCLLATACRITPPEATDDASVMGTGAKLTVDYFGDTDVVGFHFIVERVACYPGESFTMATYEANVDLSDNIFPGMVEWLEHNPMDPTSGHLGADMFLSVEPGCYDVTAVPASAISGDSWTPSADCASASTNEPVEVFEGQTTEAGVLVSQCRGDSLGALDSTVLLNHAPTFWFGIDEKYNYECEPVEVCVQAWDVDDDPIEIDFEQLEGVSPYAINFGPIEVVGFEEGARVWETCTEIVTRWTDSYEFEVSVYDMGWDGSTMVRLEDVVAPEESHASLAFPIYTNWVEEPSCIDGSGDLVSAPGVEIERYPGCAYTSAEEFYCGGGYESMFDTSILPYICDGTTLIEEAFYPECD